MARVCQLLKQLAGPSSISIGTICALFSSQRLNLEAQHEFEELTMHSVTLERLEGALLVSNAAVILARTNRFAPKRKPRDQPEA